MLSMFIVSSEKNGYEEIFDSPQEATAAYNKQKQTDLFTDFKQIDQIPGTKIEFVLDLREVFSEV